uniref:Uncharacterized protein n=1 Tax=Arundo donax TaxID=35708 RepID=A0A0A9BA71_ARUDO
MSSVQVQSLLFS